MAIQNMVNINSEALRRELQKRGLNHIEIAVEMGRGKNYLTDAFRRKRLHTATVIMLKQLYNIPSEVYVIDDEKPVEQEKECPAPEIAKMFKELTEHSTLAENILYKVVYQAVYKGVSKALRDAGLRRSN